MVSQNLILVYKTLVLCLNGVTLIVQRKKVQISDYL